MAAIALVATAAGEGGHGLAVLSLGGETLHATLLEPKGAVFSSAAVNLQPPYKPSVGVNKLMVSLPTTAFTTSTLTPTATAFPSAGIINGSKPAPPAGRIVVGFSLSAAGSLAALNPLAKWKAHGPFAGEV